MDRALPLRKSARDGPRPLRSARGGEKRIPRRVANGATLCRDDARAGETPALLRNYRVLQEAAKSGSLVALQTANALSG